MVKLLATFSYISTSVVLHYATARAFIEKKLKPALSSDLYSNYTRTCIILVAHYS